MTYKINATIMMLAVTTLCACSQNGRENESYALPEPFNQSLHVSASDGSKTIHAGYDYELSTIQGFAFDVSYQGFLDQYSQSFDNLESVCEAPDGILLSRPEDPLILHYKDGELATKPSPVECPDPSSSPVCDEGMTIFHGLLSGQFNRLSTCYEQDERTVSHHVTSPSGDTGKLGTAGTSPGGTGRFVITNGVQEGNFILHHTRNAVAESAVVLDTWDGSAESLRIPDVLDIRPRRGFAAGRVGIRLYPVQDGFIAHNEAGEVFVLTRGEREKVAENALLNTVQVFRERDIVTLVTRDEGKTRLQLYNFADIIEEMSQFKHSRQLP